MPKLGVAYIFLHASFLLPFSCFSDIITLKQRFNKFWGNHHLRSLNDMKEFSPKNICATG